MHMKRTLGLVLVSGALLVGTSCVRPDPILTPDAQLASQDGRVLDALDLIRSGSLVFHNEAGTGQLSTPLARRVVQTHESAVKLLAVRSDGYVEIIKTSLGAVALQLPPDLNRRLSPYFSLASTLLDLLTSREIDEALSAQTIAAYKTSLAESLAWDTVWLANH